MRYPLFLLAGLVLGCSCHSVATPVVSSPGIDLAENIDSIVVIKNKRLMEVYNTGRLLKTYHVSLGSEPVGPKHFKNDGKTPEGIYYIDGKNPNSQFHKCLGVSYPSAADIRYAKLAGKSTGGDIKIHGLPNGHMEKIEDFTTEDWTRGCIALTDDEIDEVYSHVATGISINILP